MTKARDIASAIPAPSTVSSAELGYLDGVTSAIQTQIDTKAPSSTAVTLTDTQTLTNKTLTNPVIASVVNNTLTSTTGDMIYASAANTPARLGIGSSAQVLTVAGGIPSWATPAAGGGMTQLLTGSLSGGSVTTSTIPSGYKDLVVIARDVVMSSNQQWTLRFNGNTGSVYQISAHNSSTTAVQNNGPGATSIDLTQGSTLEATRGHNFTLTMPEYTSNRQKYFHIMGVMIRPGNSPIAFNGVGSINTTAAITDVTFNMTAGSFTSGTYIIYGVN